MTAIRSEHLRMLLVFPGLILLGLALEKGVLVPLGAGRTPEQELAYWERYARRNPDFPSSQVRLALAGQRAGDWEGAERAYARALLLDPDSEEASVGRSDALRQIGRRAEAIALLEGFAATHPACAVCLQNLTAEYLVLGRLEVAQRTAERLLASDLTLTAGMYSATDLHGEAYLLAGRVYAARGQHARAVALFQDAARRSPGDVRAPLFEARSHLETGRAEAAREALAKAEARLSDGPQDERWRREIAALRARSGG